MPELPEVETIVRGLRREVLGRRITTVRILRDDRLLPSGRELADGLLERSLLGARRLGKHFFLDLDDGAVLAGHLRMTGQLRVQAPTEPLLAHTHALFTLDDGRELRWRDVRRFGWLHYLPDGRVEDLPSVRALGPDALTIDPGEFSARLAAARRMLKPLLLAQNVVCGLGNIYADEVLWRARLHPRQRSDRLSSRRLRELHQAMREVLEAAIRARGTSIDGAYLDPDGFGGGYQTSLAVYGREGLPAPCCGRPVRRILVASRSTYFCPHCQRRR